METFEVREEKYVGIIGGICTIFFGTLLFFSVADGLQNNAIGQVLVCGIVFGIGCFGGGFMLAAGLLRKVVVSREGCFYRTSFGRRRDFTIQEIRRCVVKEGSSEDRYRLYNVEGKLLARFEDNMIDGSELFFFLEEMEVLIETTERNTPYANLKRKWDRGKALDRHRKMQYIASRWDRKQIEKMAKGFRVIKIVTIILSVVSYVFFSYQVIFALGILTLLFWYATYLAVFPLMVADIDEGGRNWRRRHIEVPDSSIVVAMLAMFSCGTFINVRTFTRFCVCCVVAAIVLFFIFVVVSYKRVRKVKVGHCLCVFFVVLFGAFSSFTGVQWFCTIKEPIQETVRVVETRIVHGFRSGDDYLLTVDWGNGKTEELCVEFGLYEETEIGDTVVVYSEESIFGIEYCYL